MDERQGRRRAAAAAAEVHGTLEVTSTGGSGWATRYVELRKALFIYASQEDRRKQRPALCVIEALRREGVRFHLSCLSEAASRMSVRCDKLNIIYEFRAPTNGDFGKWHRAFAARGLVVEMRRSDDQGRAKTYPPQRPPMLKSLCPGAPVAPPASGDLPLRWQPHSPSKASDPVLLQGIDVVGFVGQGRFGRMYEAVNRKDPKQKYAVKAIQKYRTQHKHVVNEAALLRRARHPFIVGFFAAFQNEHYLFLILQFIPGGDLQHRINELGQIEVNYSRFYAFGVLLALEYLHQQGVVYRDLKPANIVIDAEGYPVLADMGLAKVSSGGPMTVCGTPLYLAPEIANLALAEKPSAKEQPAVAGYSNAVDWWAFGVLLYDMMNGHPPFRGKTSQAIYRSILHCQPVLDPSILTNDALPLIASLLRRCPTERAKDVKRHAFFKGIETENYFARRYLQPPRGKHASLKNASKSTPLTEADRQVLSLTDGSVPANKVIRKHEALYMNYTFVVPAGRDHDGQQPRPERKERADSQVVVSPTTNLNLSLGSMPSLEDDVLMLEPDAPEPATVDLNSSMPALVDDDSDIPFFTD